MNFKHVIFLLLTSLSSVYSDWSLPALDISVTGQDAFSPHVGVDSSGNAVAVWERSNGTNTIIQPTLSASF